jgi:hypothetical protein
MGEAAQKQKLQVEEEPLGPASISENRVQTSDQALNRWKIDVPATHRPEHLLIPAYWAHLARKLRKFDEILAWWEDNSKVARYYVLASGVNWATVVLVAGSLQELHATGAPSDVIITGHTIEWRGNVAKWAVIRDSDKKVLREGCENRADASGWLAQYARTIGQK